uniref:Uncharacterized protein n=1 Tax=Kalanchoe fedtschenkoi TaxID=63787 RepID=A0A7N0U4N9_KALFE
MMLFMSLFILSISSLMLAYSINPLSGSRVETNKNSVGYAVWVEFQHCWQFISGLINTYLEAMHIDG